VRRFDRRSWDAGRALPYLLVGPAVAVELIVHVIPSVLALVLSFLRVNQFTIAHWTDAPFAGLSNYRAGLSTNAIGDDFYSALGRTALFSVVVVAASWLVGCTAAVLLSRHFRGRQFLRIFFVIPFALPAYTTGIGWRFMLGRDNGALNRLLVDDLHIVSHRPFWLIGGNAFWVTVLVAVWRMWPFAYLMLAAAMESVPVENIESVEIDGASTWQQLRHVTLPSIRRMNLVIVVLMALWSFNEFTLPYVLFGGTPPPSANLLSTTVFSDAFSSFNVGLAAALDVVVIVIVGALLTLALRLRRAGDRDA
jgi:multiple sugar transport system permease protein